MNLRNSTACAMGLGLALTLGAATSGVAQDTTRSMRDTTQRRGVTSTRRIPVRKEMGATQGQPQQTSTGEVAPVVTGVRVEVFDAERARVDSMFSAERSRIDDLSNRLNGMNDQVAGVRRDVDALRASQLALSDSLNRLRLAFNRSRNRSLFNNSGFFVGLGLGGTFPNGTMHTIGYDHGLNVEVPIGYRKPGSLLGLQLNLGVQSFDGLNNQIFTANGTRFTTNNPDPRALSALGLVTLNLPLGGNRKNEFYLIGGGGVYHFMKYGASSTLAAQLGDDVLDAGTNTPATGERSINKWGVTGGAGLQFGMIGPTSLFIESRFTNVFTNRNSSSSIVLGNAGKNLRWVPIMVGVNLH